MTNISKKTYTLGEFIKEIKVSKDTVRNYVKRGVLSDRRNPINNYRVFVQEDVDKIKAFKSGVIIKQSK